MSKPVEMFECLNDSIERLDENYIDDSTKLWLHDIRQSIEMECVCILQGKSLSNRRHPRSHVNTLSNYQDHKDQITKFYNDCSQMMNNIKSILTNFENDDAENFNIIFKFVYDMNELITICKQHNQCTFPHKNFTQTISNVEEDVLKINLIMNSNKDQYTKKLKISIELTKLEPLLMIMYENVMQDLIKTFLNNGLNSLITLMTEKRLTERKRKKCIKEVKRYFCNLISICLLSDDVIEMIIQNGTVGHLLSICNNEDNNGHADVSSCDGSNPMKHVQAELLRSMSTICSLVRGVEEFNKNNGYEIMANLLTNPMTNHRTKMEAAGVIAQVTTPTSIPFQPIGGYLECMPHIIKALIDLLRKSTDHNEFLLCLYALDTISTSPSSSLPSSSSASSSSPLSSSLSSPLSSSSTPYDENDENLFVDYLSDVDVIEILVNRCLEYNLDKTVFAKDRILNILTSIYPHIIDLHLEQEKNIGQLLVTYLKERPRTNSTEMEMRAYEGVMQKTANLIFEMCSRKPKMSNHFIQLNCIDILLDVCKKPALRNHSDAVLDACMTALKKFHEKPDVQDNSTININNKNNNNINNNINYNVNKIDDNKTN